MRLHEGMLCRTNPRVYIVMWNLNDADCRRGGCRYTPSFYIRQHPDYHCEIVK